MQSGMELLSVNWLVRTVCQSWCIKEHVDELQMHGTAYRSLS